MTEHQEKEIQKTIYDSMRNFFIEGMSQGSKAICGLVLQKASAKNKSAEDRLGDITDFCNRSLSLKETNING